jgi:hypothetical protein
MSMMKLTSATITEYVGRRLVTVHERLLWSARRDRPAPLLYWLVSRLLVGAAFQHLDPLLPSYASLRGTGSSLQIPELRSLLESDELGTWAVDRKTVEVLWAYLQRERPRIVIECGAGVSSVMFAAYAALEQRTTKESAAIFSLEQSCEVKAAIERRLETSGLSDHVNVLHAPTSEQGVYQLDEQELWAKLGARRADWIFIDGPSGPDGCRISTLPLLAKYCRPGTRWFLDDAFRDGELQILRTWSCMPEFTVDGIFPIGKGLATGLVKNVASVL